MATPIRIKRSAIAGKRPSVDQLQKGELALNTYDAELVTLRDRFAQTGIATEVVRLGAGATVTNVIYVTKDGNDNNTGLKLGDAKGTIAGAVAISTTGSIIRVSAGSYVENNPVKLPSQVSIVGDSLREVSITPQNPGSDLFHVAPGVYISDVSFVGTMNSGSAIVAFNPDIVYYYTQSPYIHNCTNFVTNSIGMKIDGSKNIGPFKSMVTDSFTQYNSNGIGCSITNDGYAQIVSMFNINNDVAIVANSGGQCDITNSNSSFGNFGLVADGVGPRKYTGIVTTSQVADKDTFVLDLSTPTVNIQNFVYDIRSGLSTVTTVSDHGFQVGMGVTLANNAVSCAYGNKTYPHRKPYIFEVESVPSTTTFSVNVGISTVAHTYQSGGTAKIDVDRPYDGQLVYFDKLYKQVKSITVTNGGSGYTSTPTITVGAPTGPSGETASAYATLDGTTIKSITLISSGNQYLTTPDVTISGGGGDNGAATASMDPLYYTINSSTPVSSGISTITLATNLLNEVGIGSTVFFSQGSRIVASSHTFEYVGAGDQIVTATPKRGGVTIQANEVITEDGGKVLYTSTDQAGNFRIGDDLKINQETGTISGRAFSKSLFSEMTPFILALS